MWPRTVFTLRKECGHVWPRPPLNVGVIRCPPVLRADQFWQHHSGCMLIPGLNSLIGNSLFIPCKGRKWQKKSCNVKESERKFQDPSVHLDLQQKLLWSILRAIPYSSCIQICSVVFVFCVMLLTNQPTNKPMDMGENITSLVEVITSYLYKYIQILIYYMQSISSAYKICTYTLKNWGNRWGSLL